MATPKQAKPQAEQTSQTKLQLHAVIGNHVIETLGQASDLHKLQVRHLWDHCYRVNIMLGQDALSARIAHSYFLEVDGEGNILASSPRITRHYASLDASGFAPTSA